RRRHRTAPFQHESVAPAPSGAVAVGLDAVRGCGQKRGPARPSRPSKEPTMVRIAALCLVCALPLAGRADEGMWTYDNFPSAKVAKKYGFSPDSKWLAEAQLSSVRLAGGCSGSFVSPEGLVMTNHHCGHSCIEQLSTKDKDFVKEGFYAATLDQEVKCPEIELNQLTGISDVSERMHSATQGLEGQKFAEAQRAEMAKIEQECSGGDDKVRCDVVTLYH